MPAMRAETTVTPLLDADGAAPTGSKPAATAQRARPRRLPRPDATTIALGATLAVALVLRVWGIRHGLPFIYNVDEERHFVPVAAKALDGAFHPESFVNPPGFAYLLSLLYAVWYGGAGDALHRWEADPAQLYLLGRLAAAALGTLSAWLLYVAGTRLFGRTAGLVAAAAMAVAFLPVFYSHHALNDVPAMTAFTLSLVGTAGVLRKGRAIDYTLGGAAAGLAAATKYPSGIALLAVVLAGTVRALDAGERRRALGGIALGVASALVTFLCANPFALLAFQEMRADLEFASRYVSGHLIGLPFENGYTYYLWTLTWGLGWVPALAALAGGLLLLARDARAAAVLLPTGLVFYLIVGSYAPLARYFLPAFPIVCLLAGYAVARLVAIVPKTRPRLRAATLAVALAVVTGQGLVYAVHNDLILSRTDTRTLARTRMLTQIPAGATIVLEPIVPKNWLPRSDGKKGWDNFRIERAYRDVTGRGRIDIRAFNYVRFLRPEFVDYYRANGVCWVITGTTISGRAFAEPRRAPGAVAYYERLDREAELVFQASPYDAGAGPVAYGYAFRSNYYPLAYHRAGPEVSVYRIRGGRCA
jgi:hypothetical protein